ncbi:wings apart-like protein homolog [Halichondria panicea]|uniref:wings apart-like protein homolog n=1 Tax=Halichondria panicea TaxID=6063 RepID=UPI00312BB676
MASYRSSYSKRSTRTSRDTTASELFDELISSKESTPAASQISLPEPKVRSRILTKACSLPHAPEECSTPQASTVEEATTEKETSSWSKRRYEYSFSPRSKPTKKYTRKPAAPKATASRKTQVFDFDDCDGENETNIIPKVKVQKPRVPFSKPPPGMKNGKTTVKSQNKTKSMSNEQLNRPRKKNTVSAESKEQPKTSRVRRLASIERSDTPVTDVPEKKTAATNLQETSGQNFRGGSSVADKTESPMVVVEDCNPQNSTSHTLTTHTSTTRTTNTRRAKRLDSTKYTSNSAKRPRVEANIIPKLKDSNPQLVTSETRSSCNTGEVIKSPLDELLESPVKKLCISPADNTMKSNVPLLPAKDSKSSLSQPSLLCSDVKVHVTSPIKSSHPAARSPISKTKSKSNWDYSDSDSDSDSEPEIPPLKKSSSVPSAPTVSALTRTASWPRQHPLFSSHRTTSRPQSTQQRSIAPTSNKASRKYSLFNQPGGSKEPDEDGRSQRVYSYNPTAPTSNKAPRKYSLFNQPGGSKKPDEDGRSQRVYSYNPTAPTSNKAPRKYSLFNQPEGSKEPDGDGRSQQVYSYKVRNMAEETGAAAGGSKRALSNKSKEPTIVRNVRQARECLEIGESQEFFDEVRYLLGSIKPAAPLKSRCLGTLNLADQFLDNDFSQQLRSQGFTSKIMALLSDCLEHPTLCLCTAVLFYTITRDKLNSDWTKGGIKTLVSMLSINSWNSNSDPKLEQEMLKMKQKCVTILEKVVAEQPSEESEGSQEEKEDNVQNSEPPEYKVDAESFTINELARETLTSLIAPQHNPQTLRNHLRTSGALDKLANNTIDCSKEVPGVRSNTSSNGCSQDDHLSQKLITLERYLKLIENCTLMSSDNQNYLVVFDGSVFITRLVKLISACFNMMSSVESLSQVLCQTLIAVFKVLLNLTHENELGCDRVGCEEGAIDALLQCVLMLPSSLPQGKQFDIMAPALGVLINLTEHSGRNRRQLELTKIKGHGQDKDDELLRVQKNIGFHGDDSALKALMDMFLKHHRMAEAASIAVPSPQRLSQLASSPHSSPYVPNRGQGSSSARRDLGSTFANRLKTAKSPQKGGAVLRESQDSQSSQGSTLPPTDSDESEEEAYESIPTDPMVYSREEFDTALHQAGRHLEDSVLASYTALLVGILVKSNSDLEGFVKGTLPSGSFAEMIGMLRKFVSFMNMTGSTTGLESIRHIIRYLDALN